MSRPRVLAAVVLLGALTACSQGPAPVRVGDETAVQTVDGSLAVLRPPPPLLGGTGGPDAIVAGTLAVLDGGCLGFRGEDGSQLAVVWPSGTTALPDAVGVDVPGMGAYRLGEAVEGGGGYGGVPFQDVVVECSSTQVAYLNEDQRP